MYVQAWRRIRFARRGELAVCGGLRPPSGRTLDGVKLGAVAGHQQLRHEACPAGLMRGAHAPAAVAMKVFIEEDVVAKVRILEGALVHAVNGPISLLVGEEQARQA